MRALQDIISSLRKAADDLEQSCTDFIVSENIDLPEARRLVRLVAGESFFSIQFCIDDHASGPDAYWSIYTQSTSPSMHFKARRLADVVRQCIDHHGKPAGIETVIDEAQSDILMAMPAEPDASDVSAELPL